MSINKAYGDTASVMCCLWLLLNYSDTVEELQLETMWPRKPKIFSIWTVVGKAFQPLRGLMGINKIFV